MSSIVGGDYYESTGVKAPDGLVSDPPRYGTCVAAIESIGPPKSGTQSAAHSEDQGICHQLYQSIKQQALSYLFSDLGTIQEGAENGIQITDAEVNAGLSKIKAERFPGGQQFASYISNHNWALSDELSLIKRNLLQERLQAKLEKSLHGKVSGGQLAFERAVVQRQADNAKGWSGRTTCTAGYLAPGCKGYKAPATPSPSPDQLLEQIAASR